MPETKFVVFDTKYKTDPNNGDALTITLQREIEFENVLESQVNLSLKAKNINNKKIIPGELGVILKHQLTDIDLFIDNNGHLIVSGEDAKNYSLNAQGHLIYTYR